MSTSEGTNSSPITQHSSSLDYLVVGHVTKDVAPKGYVFGGTACFASLTARNLGRRAGVLTRSAWLPDLPEYLRGVALHLVPADETTTFENIYTPSGRVQYLRATAPPIPADAVPAGWRTVPVVHLGPVAQEVPAELADVFPAETLVGATPQGWLRAWDDDGLVRVAPWKGAERALSRIDVLVFSAEDMGGDLRLVRRYAEMARLAVVTESRSGCTIWHAGRGEHYPAFEIDEVEPTGAGDVFTAAFLLRYGDTRDRAEAARYANCAASFAVEGYGTASIPSREQVEARLRTGTLRRRTG
ncbi:MAG: PfkB family carbohydrate kinase [Chloroflexota bacterium]